MVILLEPEVYQEEIVATLVGAGHTVKCLQRHSDEYAFIFGPRAWRIPGDPKNLDPVETLRLIGTAVKSAETLAKVQAKNEGKEVPIKKKRTVKEPKAKKPRKKGKDDGTASVESGNSRAETGPSLIDGSNLVTPRQASEASVSPDSTDAAG